MAEGKVERRGLGRGLSALMADVESATPEAIRPVNDDTPRPSDRFVPIERLHPNPDQPRRRFDGPMLAELAESIAARGIIQPLIVRVHPSRADEYEIVAGERRWRAAQKAQLHEVPIILRDFTDTEVLEVAIVENIQRADLNAVEEAQAYRQLIDRFGHTQDHMAEALGKSRSHIANLMRLLTLPEDVIEHLKEGRLSAGHARALVTSENASELANEVIAKGLSVRDTEKLAKRETDTTERQPSSDVNKKDADTRALEQDLSAALGFNVRIDHKGDGGVVSIKYTSLDALDDLCAKLSAAR